MPQPQGRLVRAPCQRLKPPGRRRLDNKLITKGERLARVSHRISARDSGQPRRSRPQEPGPRRAYRNPLSSRPGGRQPGDAGLYAPTAKMSITDPSGDRATPHRWRCLTRVETSHAASHGPAIGNDRPAE